MGTKVNIDLMPSGDRDNFTRLTRLLIAAGTPILRELLDSHYPPQRLASGLNARRGYLESRAKLTKTQKELLFPAAGVPDSQTFDLTLLIKLLRNICFTRQPTRGSWDVFPDENDVALEDHVVRILLYRNHIYAHAREKMAISADDFQTLWKEISKAVRQMASYLKNIDMHELEEQMSKLRFSPLTKDDIQDALAAIEETQSRHETNLRHHQEILDRHDQTLSSHDEALSRIDAQGNDIQKEIQGLHDKVLQNESIQNSKPMNSTKIASENLTQNINNNFTLNINDPRFMVDMFKLYENVTNQLQTPKNSKMLGVDETRAVLSSQPVFERSVSYPNYDKKTYEGREHIQFPTNSSEAYSERQQMPTSSPQSRMKTQKYNQDTIEMASLVDAPEFVPRNTKDENKPINWNCLPESPPPSASSCPEFTSLPSGTKNQSNLTNMFSGRPIYTSKESKDIFQFPASPSDTTAISNLPDKIQTMLQANQTFTHRQSELASYVDAPEFVPRQNQLHKAKDDKPNCQADKKRSYHSSSTSPSSFPSSPTQFHDNMQSSSGSTSISVTKIDAAAPLLPKNSFRSQWPMSTRVNNSSCYDGDQDLHIEISVLGNPFTTNFHLGRLISDHLNETSKAADDDGFRGYLECKRRFKITKIDASRQTSCCIGITASDISSLEKLWKDCVTTDDLKQFLKGELQLSGVDIDINIDGKEYETCCKRLKSRNLAQMGAISHSDHRFGYTEELSDEEDDPRSRSMEEISSLQRALDELFLVVCKNEGTMKYDAAVQQLSVNSKLEIIKAFQQGRMDSRFRILPNQVIQGRLNFCHKKVTKDGRKCDDDRCPNLHLCPHFLLDKCTFSANTCERSHDIRDAHTKLIFKKTNLHKLSNEERLVLLKNVAYTVPETCNYYLKMRCKKGNECSYLHVCKNWILDKCLFKRNCRHSHTLNEPSSQRILQEKNLHNLDEEEIKEKIREQIASN